MPLNWKFPDKLRYYAREIIIVIIGILIAFTLNSWWQNLKERTDRRILLSDLASQYNENIQEINRSIGIHKNVQDRCRLLLDQLRSDTLLMHINTTDTLINTTLICATYDPFMGTVNSILNSGRLELVGDQELIFQLTSLEGHLEDVREDEALALEFTENQYYPYLRTRIDMYFLAERNWNVENDSVRFSGIAYSFDLENTLELRNILAQRLYRQRLIVSGLKSLRDRQMETLIRIQKLK